MQLVFYFATNYVFKYLGANVTPFLDYVLLSMLTKLIYHRDI